MYDDDYDNKRDSRRLSYISSPLSETISTASPSSRGSDTLSPNSYEHQRSNRQSRVPANGSSSSSSDRGDAPSSPRTNRTPSGTATTSFPLNDVDYESDPAAVAQELSNLAAIRRMSMDVTATGDPDLPSFGSNLVVPSAPSADEDDASRLFWVPARLHPELAPKEFKSFLESKTEQIKRRSGEFSSGGLSVERQLSDGGGLRRKRSMLSRQIDNSSGYTDGAERLERKRSQSEQGKQESMNPNLSDLEVIVDDSKDVNKDAASLLRGVQTLDISAAEDRPILPPAPPGSSLRRSTRTQYRKGSLRKGERPPYSKRLGKATENADGGQKNGYSSDEAVPTPGITRVLTDPGPGLNGRSLDEPKAARNAALDALSGQQDPSNKTETPETRQWHSRISSNGRSTLDVPPSSRKTPQGVEPARQEENRTASSSIPPAEIPARSTSRGNKAGVIPQVPPIHEQAGSRHKRPPLTRQSASTKDTTQTMDDLVSKPASLPGNSTRTDSLSFIPTMPEEKKPEKPEGKKSKDKKDSEGNRKSSWHWLLGHEDKEKDKDKKKEKDSDSKKSKAKLSPVSEKAQEPVIVEVPETATEPAQRRESLVLERPDPRLEEERRKESLRKTSGDSKKEKESGLFSSIFGGGKKKNSGDSTHKKSASRHISPDPPVRELRPDVDYNWSRFSILEERAIYRMAHIKLANPRRELYSQVLLSNFMYSYLAKVQQMHPQMMLPTSPAQRQQKSREQQRQQQQQQQPEEYSQYQRYQEVSAPICIAHPRITRFLTRPQQQQYGDTSYDESDVYDYEDDDRHDPYRQQSTGAKHGYDNGATYGPGHHQQYADLVDDPQLDDDDDMW
ncbi:telomere silencing protein Zds1, putative [Paecilomyces variotii No. 5]|uniref:Telomere silencing protein Zds1, putative n=1 Tax=Byssochlamys spectabilis (strain No. 5 / NBRC 109023) TaxID=1356009 RepID=V5GCZ1_BYSSN|nr:telomere silencing protein Zds1, putative [Paecilomyces variotii No. 5]